MRTFFWCFFALVLAGCATAPRQADAGTEPASKDAGVYMIVLGKVYDRAAFMSGYAAKLPPLYEKFGGEYVALSRELIIFEGEPGFESVVIARWPSEAAARAFWTSPEYEELIRARTENGWGDFTVVIVPALMSPVQRAPALEN